MKDLEIIQIRKLVFYALVTLIFLGAGFLLIRNFENLYYWNSPKIQKPKITSVESQKLIDSGIKFDFKVKSKQLIEKPVIYQTNNRVKLTTKLAASLATRLGFTVLSESFSDNILIWQRGKEKLSINLEGESLEYFFNYDQNQLTSGKVTSLASAKAEFKKLYRQLGLNEDFINFNSPQVVYANAVSSNSNAKVDPNLANIINLTYTLNFANLPLVNRATNPLQAKVTYARNNLLLSAKIPLVLEKYQPDLEYPGLSQVDLVNELQKEKGTLIKYENIFSRAVLKTERVVSAKINKINSVYLRAGFDYNYLIPSYIIEGEGVTSGSVKIRVVFYLPAFRSVFFK